MSIALFDDLRNRLPSLLYPVFDHLQTSLKEQNPGDQGLHNAAHIMRSIGEYEAISDAAVTHKPPLRTMTMIEMLADLGKFADELSPLNRRKLLQTASIRLPEDGRPSNRVPSQTLISALQGKNKYGKLILEALRGRVEGKHAEKPLLNPQLNPSQIRRIFTDNPSLLGFFHELPGISFLIDTHQARQISDDEFKEVFLGILFHNGPEAGYWEKFTKICSPVAKNTSLIEGTIFENPETGDLRYGNPLSAAGVLHTIVDRFDQATSGIVKIACECASFMSLKDIYHELLQNNQAGTVEQLRKLFAWFTSNKFKTILANDFKRKIPDGLSEEAKTQRLNIFVNSFIDFTTRLTNGAIKIIQDFSSHIDQRISLEEIRDHGSNTVRGTRLIFNQPDGSREVLEENSSDGQKTHYHYLLQDLRHTGSTFVVNKVGPFLSQLCGALESVRSGASLHTQKTRHIEAPNPADDPKKSLPIEEQPQMIPAGIPNDLVENLSK